AGQNAFQSWSGNCTGSTSPTCTLTNITTAPAQTVVFFTKTFAVVVQGQGGINGAGSGTVTGGGLNCAISNGVGTCSVNVNYNNSITLSEVPATGANAFVNWSGGCNGIGTTCTIPNIISTPNPTTATFT